MNYYDTPASAFSLPEADRAAFIRRTYAHLAGAVAAFIAFEALLFMSGAAAKLMPLMLGGKWSWLLVLGAFMLVSHIAERWASSTTKRSTQYLGLGLFVIAEAILFVPLIGMVIVRDPSVLAKGLLITTGLFLGLTWVATATRKDFSFLGGFLKIALMVAFATIIASILFGFSLGTFFCLIMVALVGGCILYQTSNVLHHYHTDQHVSAALALFSSFATLLWYVFRLLSARE